jgi:uncharacterized membrane protein
MRSIMGEMAERRFSARVKIDRPPQAAFDWVSDYHNAARVLDGVTRWKPVGFKTRGAGARFDVAMRALGFPLEAVLVIDTWREPRAISWHSENGLIPQAGGWTFDQRDGGTEVTLTIAYQPPAGQVGAAVAGPLDKAVRRRLETALARMKREVEAP